MHGRTCRKSLTRLSNWKSPGSSCSSRHISSSCFHLSFLLYRVFVPPAQSSFVLMFCFSFWTSAFARPLNTPNSPFSCFNPVFPRNILRPTFQIPILSLFLHPAECSCWPLCSPVNPLVFDSLPRLLSLSVHTVTVLRREREYHLHQLFSPARRTAETVTGRKM